MLKDYGLRLNRIRPLVFGYQRQIINPEGKWLQSIPVYEPQFGDGWDSFGCTVWGTLNAIETIHKFKTGIECNLSERFIYILGNVNPPGHDPLDIAKVFKKYRDVDESFLPMTKTYAEFKTPNPIPQNILDNALSFPYELDYEIAWIGVNSQEKQTQLIREKLKYSPLGVTVTAWFRKDNIYVDNDIPNTHWCVLVEECPGKGWYVFDSYDQSVKVISYDHKIYLGVNYFLTEQEALKISLLKTLLGLYQQLLTLLMPPTKKITNSADILYKKAKSLLGVNLAPGNEMLGCAISMSAVYNKAFPNEKPLRFVNTSQWYEFMKDSPLFEEQTVPSSDCIIVSVTDQIPSNSPLRNGHIGTIGRIASSDGSPYIMSNDSSLGYWNTQWTYKEWMDHYSNYGKIPTYIFKLI